MQRGKHAAIPFVGRGRMRGCYSTTRLCPGSRDARVGGLSMNHVHSFNCGDIYAIGVSEYACWG